jgi:hypothetical protein
MHLLEDFDKDHDKLYYIPSMFWSYFRFLNTLSIRRKRYIKMDFWVIPTFTSSINEFFTNSSFMIIIIFYKCTFTYTWINFHFTHILCWSTHFLTFTECFKVVGISTTSTINEFFARSSWNFIIKPQHCKLTMSLF